MVPPPGDTLEKQHPDYNPTHTNQSYQIGRHTNTANMTGSSNLSIQTKYKQTKPNDDVDCYEHIWLLTMPKLETMQNSTAPHYQQQLPLT